MAKQKISTNISALAEEGRPPYLLILTWTDLFKLNCKET